MTKTVLLVDYDPNSIGRIRRTLGPAGVRVELALDGRSGVAEAQRLRPAVTIVQDLLPGIGGLDVCGQIKHTAESADLPVVILTGPRQHVTLMKTDCDAYIEKPYQDGELLEIVQALLKRSGGVAAGPPRRPERVASRPAIAPVAAPPVCFTEADLDARLDEVLVLAPRVAVAG
ncbi:MAG TPA: response regulator [Candidatus Polarisedimenticolaceae bacterium]|nr:response regulator [Candidatus Polarisedimenticolaceae bacterium]